MPLDPTQATAGSFTPATTTAATNAGQFGGNQDFSGSTGGFNLDNILGKIGQNPGVLLSAAPLALDLLKGNQALPAQKQVQQQAGEAASVGRTLEAYQGSGTLPSGLQDVVNLNKNAAIAQVNDTYSQLGLANSTQHVQAVQQIHEAYNAQVAQIGQQLAQQGLQWTQLSANEFNTLLDTQLKQEQGLQNALASFAGGLARVSGGGSSTSST